MTYCRFFLIIAAFSMLNCGTTNWTLDERSGKPMLNGTQPRTAFNDTSYSWWWNSESELYVVDSTTIKKCVADLKSVSTKIIMGTWCSDSRREVPRLFKIFDKADYSDTSKIHIICVNREKKTRVKEEIAGLEIEKVPTIILYRDNKEIGRIVESPQESLEKDLLKILQPK